MALTALVFVMFGVGYLIYMNKIREKEIATKLQKDLSFGLTAFAGLAGGIIGVIQIAVYPAVPSTLVWMAAGGFINFVTGVLALMMIFGGYVSLYEWMKQFSVPVLGS